MPGPSTSGFHRPGRRCCCTYCTWLFSHVFPLLTVLCSALLCVFFALNRSFYPSTSSTPSVRADSSFHQKETERYKAMCSETTTHVEIQHCNAASRSRQCDDLHGTEYDRYDILYKRSQSRCVDREKRKGLRQKHTSDSTERVMPSDLPLREGGPKRVSSAFSCFQNGPTLISSDGSKRVYWHPFSYFRNGPTLISSINRPSPKALQSRNGYNVLGTWYVSMPCQLYTAVQDTYY